MFKLTSDYIPLKSTIKQTWQYIFIVFLSWTKLLGLFEWAISPTCSIKHLHRQMPVFKLLTGDNNWSTWVQCIYENYISRIDINQQGSNQWNWKWTGQKAVIGLSTVKSKTILLCCSHSFYCFQGISNKLFFICLRKEITSLFYKDRKL